MAKRKRQLVKPGHAIAATLVGFALLAGAVVGVNAWLPAQDFVPSARNYGYVYSGAKSSSVTFNTNTDGENSFLLFGSSELSTPSKTVPEVPAVVFGDYSYGIDLTYVGEAYDQSLWHAIAAGAYAGHIENNKCAIIVSPGWFEDGGIDNTTFGMRFSYGLYRAFCNNSWISDASKAYVAKRLAQQGIDQSVINAARPSLPQDYVNDAFYTAMDDLKIRNELRNLRTKGLDQRNRSEEAPEFSEWREVAYEDAKALSTNNDMGFDNAFYTNTIAPEWNRLHDLHADETYTNTPEFDDFNFFLKVCEETELEPLVIIAPLHGDFFDYEGIGKDVRNDCYTHIRHICEKHGVACEDLSSHEYDKYYLHDIVHFGGPGWVDVEEAIFTHVFG